MIKNKQSRKRFERALTKRMERLHPLVESCDVGTIPVPGRYPCDSLKVCVRVLTKFPPGVSDSYPTEFQLQHHEEFGNCSITVWPPKNFGEQATKNELAYFVREVDAALESRLKGFGCVEFGRGHPWTRDGGDGVDLLVPLWDDTDHGHYMSKEQERRFEEECGRPPYSDEAWIIDRYCGIGICRSAMFHGEYHTPSVPAEGKESP